MVVYQVKRCDHCVRGTARNDAAESACCEVVARVELYFLLGLEGAEFVCHCVVCAASIAGGSRYRGSMVGDVVSCFRRERERVQRAARSTSCEINELRDRVAIGKSHPKIPFKAKSRVKAYTNEAYTPIHPQQ